MLFSVFLSHHFQGLTCNNIMLIPSMTQPIGMGDSKECRPISTDHNKRLLGRFSQSESRGRLTFLETLGIAPVSCSRLHN